jgi:glucose uptake protein GlcU
MLISFASLGMLTAFGGLLLLTACMKKYDATYSAAMFVGSFVITTSIMSAVHYDTFDHLNDIENLILYPTGLVILMVGVCLLVMERKNDSLTSNESENSPSNTPRISSQSSII